jgi:hypothetical protein
MDLSRLPEPLRSNLEKQLAAMPAEVRVKLEAQLGRLPVEQLTAVLSRNSALIGRLAGKASSASAGAKSAGAKSASWHGTVGGGHVQAQRRYDPHDHYNTTISRGDRATPPFFVIVVCAAAALAILYSAGFVH